MQPGKRRPETPLRNGHANPILDPEVPDDTARKYLLDPRIYGEHPSFKNFKKTTQTYYRTKRFNIDLYKYLCH